MDDKELKVEETKEVVEEPKVEEPKVEETKEEAKKTTEAPKKKSVFSKVLNILSYVLIGLLVVVDGLALYGKFSMKGESGGLPLFNKEARIVLTGSMDNQDDSFYTTGEGKDYEIKRIPVHSLVFIDKAPSLSDKVACREWYGNIKVNDILTFNYQLGGQFYVVTHRVIAINNTNPDHVIFTLRGDNPEGDSVVSKYSPTQEAWSDSGYIIGKVTGFNEFIGHIMYAFVGNQMALIFIVIIPSVILMFYEIGNVIYLVYLNKKEKVQVEREAAAKSQEEELLRLRIELAKLQQAQREAETDKTKETTKEE